MRGWRACSSRTCDLAACAGAATGATSLVTNSRYTAGQIRAAYGREANVVRCGVPDRILAAAGPLPPRHLLSVGQLIARKGHDLVIAAAARTRRRWPVLVMSSREDLGERRRLHALAAAASVPLDIRVAASDDELVEAVATIWPQYALANCAMAVWCEARKSLTLGRRSRSQSARARSGAS